MSTNHPTPTKGVEIELDRKRYLRFPLGILKRLEQDEGMTMAGLIHSGLLADDPELTVEAVEQMIDLETLPTLRDPLLRATGRMVDLAKMFPAMFPEKHVGDPTEAATT